MILKRGNIVIYALQGDFGKPRPALVVQSDLFNETHSSVTILPITSHAKDAPLFRIKLEPSTDSGLEQYSFAMVDKITSIPRSKISRVIGSISDNESKQIKEALELWLLAE